ncbi:hypothetical protein BOTBODRAFT_33289 [Botryobasidium botryosum FD-172 SS1]|uniref:Uncharacterized protein n=1 Tax=Botryobasidium botryosum (strain FD-172 SS1) TaxID=930990 RepID=A0A067MEB1_BOTB1|nr:hypothetical protein BOTBODRAFT_33289 [Botryobasidium botryosum FD-172 SS1]
MLSAISASDSTLSVNRHHRAALEAHVLRLKAALDEVDNLLIETVSLETEEAHQLEEGEFEDRRGIFLHAGAYAEPIFTKRDLYLEGSPFLPDSQLRDRFLAATTPRPFSIKERQTLVKLVRSQNKRLTAEYLKRRNHPNPFEEIRSRPEATFETNTEGLDWNEIARDVSAACRVSPTRSPQECKVQWLGSDHPRFVGNGGWSDEETAKLAELIGEKNAQNGEVDWVDVAAQLGTSRTPLQCMRQHMFHDPELALQENDKKTWTKQEDQALIQATRDFGTSHWGIVALHVGSDRTPVQCMHRWIYSLDPSIKHGRWTAEEDQLLLSAVAIHGSTWVKVKACIPGRTGAQCRERWCNAVDPKIKRCAWSPEEDALLREARVDKGMKSWSDISKGIFKNERTDRQCVRRWEALQKDPTGKTGAGSSNPSARPRKGKRKPKEKPNDDGAGAGTEAKTGGTEEGDGQSKPARKPNPRKKRPAEVTEDEDDDDEGADGGAPADSSAAEDGRIGTAGSRTESTKAAKPQGARKGKGKGKGKDVDPAAEGERPADFEVTGVAPPKPRPKPRPRARKRKGDEKDDSSDVDEGATPKARGKNGQTLLLEANDGTGDEGQGDVTPRAPPRSRPRPRPRPRVRKDAAPVDDAPSGDIEQRLPAPQDAAHAQVLDSEKTGMSAATARQPKTKIPKAAQGAKRKAQASVSFEAPVTVASRRSKRIRANAEGGIQTEANTASAPAAPTPKETGEADRQGSVVSDSSGDSWM